MNNHSMAYPGFPGPGLNAGQGAPSHPSPLSTPQGQFNPQLQLQLQQQAQQQQQQPQLQLQQQQQQLQQPQQQYGLNQQPGAGMLPPQKPNAATPASGSATYSVPAYNMNAQSFATPPLPTPSHPQTPNSQAPPPPQAAAQATPMANPTAATTAPAPSTSAKSTPTSEVPPQSSPKQAHKLSPQDEKRVAAILHLNNVIIKELSALQASGPDKPQSPSQASNPASAPAITSPSTTTPTDPNAPAAAAPPSGTPTSATTPAPRAQPTKKQVTENYSRRLQVNIAYLLGMSQSKPVPSFPQAMEPPPESWIAVAEGTKEQQKERWGQMRDAYKRLKESWPDYRLGMRPQIPPGMHQGSNHGQSGQHQHQQQGVQQSQTAPARQGNQQQLGQGQQGQQGAVQPQRNVQTQGQQAGVQAQQQQQQQQRQQQ